MSQAVPDILRQRFIELEGTSFSLIPNINKKQERLPQTKFDNGSFLLWKGVETGFFCVTSISSPGTVIIYEGQNDKTNIILNYKFGRAATIIDVLYFPIAADQPGILVAVADRSIEKGDYIAFISLRSKKLLKSCYMPYPITKLCSILDGTCTSDSFLRLAKSFNKDWSHIILVGCRFGYASLICMDLAIEDSTADFEFLTPITGSPTKSNGNVPRPSRPKKNVHLSKIFYDDQMFAFRADDGTTRCIAIEHVFVSALHWIEKSGLVIIGFNFGGIMIVSLRTSKVFSLLYIDGMVQHFAFQEPEEDPRPLFYLWIAYNSIKIGSTLLLCTVNFPKDEQVTSNSAEYTFLEPYFTPCMKWAPDNCNRLLVMRTIYRSKKRYNQNNNSSQRPVSSLSNSFSEVHSKNDTALLFISWIEKSRFEEANLHGALFDLNAFYAKRLIARIQHDATIARQLPFIARFFYLYVGDRVEHVLKNNSILDISVSNVHQFAPPAFLNENIDQLYYPSTYHIEVNCLTPTRIFKAKVRPIQTHLIIELAKAVYKHFESPHNSATWIHAIGMANSAPANNLNEERACLLRIIVHSFFPAILTLIDSINDNMDHLKFIQKWVWKEVEVTKLKFDELCVPLFDNPPHEPSPSACGFIQHARVFFKRASIIFEALDSKICKLSGKEKSRSIHVQGKITRQLRLYSSSIAFALVYNLLPVNKLNSNLYEVVNDRFSRFSERSRRRGKHLKIYSLLDEIIKSKPDEEIWQGKSANGWYPPRDFKCLLPILLLLNVTEKAKLTLLGYYCLDLESASAVFGSEVQAKDGNTPPTSSLHLNRTFSVDFNAHPYQNREYFSLFLSFVLQEDFSLEEMNKIRAFWLEDKNNLQLEFPDQPLVTEMLPFREDDEEFNPLENIQKTKDFYLRKKWGIFLFNNVMLENRRYKLLMDMPPLKGNEPEFVQKCYVQCMDVRRQFPSLFKKIEPLPTFIMDRYRAKIKSNRGPGKILFPIDFEESQNQPILPLRIKHSPLVETDNFPKLFSKSDGVSILGKRSLTNRFSAASDEDTEHFEEMPLTIATPRKRQRLFIFDSSQGIEATPTALAQTNNTSPVICEDIQQGCVNSKEWDRISRITQTPLSLRKSINQSRMPLRESRINSARNALFRDVGHSQRQVIQNGQTPTRVRDQNGEVSPEPNILPIQPPSILKSDNRKSRLPSASRTEKPKIRFAQSLFTTERIPSRFEKATAEMNDTSFSNFTEFSPSESSPTSSRSGQQPGSESGNSSTQIQLKTPKKKIPLTPKKKTTPKKASPVNSPRSSKMLRRSPRHHSSAK